MEQSISEFRGERVNLFPMDYIYIAIMRLICLNAFPIDIFHISYVQLAADLAVAGRSSVRCCVRRRSYLSPVRARCGVSLM